MNSSDLNRDVPGGSPPEPHQHHVDVGSAPPVTPVSTRRMTFVGIGAVVVLVALFVIATLPRQAVSRELATEVAAESLPPMVQVTTVHRATAGSAVELPGTIQALHEGAIYARVSGYVKSWHFDIGSVVHTGDVLAEIDAPELAQNVEQARHQLAQVRATLGLAQADLARWKEMATDSAVSREELDQKQAGYDVAAANVGAAQANLQRLVELEGFTRVKAPFTGVVTGRNVDIGSLITVLGATSAPVSGGDVAGAPGAGSMFRIAETDTVRIFVPVPENYATAMEVGLAADVDVQELPGRTFAGHIVRTSHALDAASRTLLTEIDVANPHFALLPGMYAQVRMRFPTSAPPLVIPAAALVIRSEGTEVMVVDKEMVHLRPVRVGRDYGATIEILGGIDDGAVVVTNPNPDVSEGTRVRVSAGANPADPAASPAVTRRPSP
jgi:RND family efflux transporter MFP subunit